MDENETVCPACGKAVDEPVPEAEAPVETPEAAEAQPAAPAPKKQHGGLIIALVAAVAVIIVLIVLLVQARKTPETAPEDTVEEPTAQTGEEAPAEETPVEEPAEEETPFVPSVSYTKDADAFDDATLDQVVATVADSTLTNRKLAYYYWREYYSFVSMYGSYVSYIMDPYSRLYTQAYTDAQSWAQLFMELGYFGSPFSVTRSI